MGQNLGPLNIKNTYQDLLQISGSDIVTDGTGSVVSSLDIAATSATTATTANTASYVAGANVDGTVASATSASHALIADTALNVPVINTGSFMVTGSVSGQTLTFNKADGSTFDLEVVATGSAAESLVTASAADATITFTKGDTSTFNVTVDNVSNASFATNAGSATNATFAVTSSYIAGANVDGAVALATTASHALVADSATTATTANTASYVAAANVDGTVATATSASHALVADSVSGTVTNAVSASYVPGAGVDGAVALATEVDVTTQTAGQYRVAFTDQTGTTSGISNSTSLTWDEGTDTLAGAAAVTATTFNGDLNGNAATATTASYAQNFDTPTLQEVTTAGATTTDAISLTNADGTYFTTQRGGVDQIRFISNDTLNLLRMDPSGSQALKLDFQGAAEIETLGDLTIDNGGSGKTIITNGSTPFEIDTNSNDVYIGIPGGGSSGDLTIRGATTGNYELKMYTTSEIHLSGSVVKVDSDISASGAVSASTYYGDGSNLTGISSSPFPYTGSVNIKPDGGTFTGTPGTDTAIMNVDNVNGNISANGNLRTFAGGLFSTYSGSSAEDIEIDNNKDTFVYGAERSQYSSVTVNNMTGSVVLAVGKPGVGIYAGSDGSYPNPPRNSAVIASNGNFRGGMINCAMIAHDGGNMNGAGNYGYGMVLMGGQNGRLNRNYRSVIIGGNNNQMPNSFQDGLGIFAGQNNTLYGNSNTMVGVQSGQIQGGGNNYIGGGRNQTMGSGADTCAIFGGWENNLGSGHTDTIVGGRANIITNRNTNAEAGNGILFGRRNRLESNNMDQTFIIGGAYNTVSGSFQGGGVIGGSGSLATHDRSVVIGGFGLSSSRTDEVTVPNLTATGSFILTGSAAMGIETYPSTDLTNGNFVIGGSGNGNPNNGPRITGGTAGVVIGGYLTTQASTGTWNSMFGGSGNSISGTGGTNTVVGGYYSSISGGGTWGSIFGAKNSSITSTGAQPRVLIGGDGNSITAGADTAIIAGTGNSVAHDRSVVVGGSSLSSTKADEVTVPNLTVSGSMVGQVGVITPSAATGSMDCSTGNFFTMTLDNGTDVRLEASNIQTGQTINLKLTNNATAAGTISFGPEFEFEGGTAFTATATTSAVDVMTFISFDGTTLQATGLKNFS